MVTYGPTQENLTLLFAKAKEKANGVYSFRGMDYRVRDGRVTHYSYERKIMELCGYFVVEVGNYAYSSEAVKMLKGI